MKLAEALLERVEIKQKLNVLQNRLLNNAKVQEGMEPNEYPKDLLKELDENIKKLEFLIVHINKTNEITKNEKGFTISELIAKRDVLTQKYSIVRLFLDNGSAVINRLTHTEIKLLTTFS
ncbi:MAG: DIP1984 family protein, partial [Clostridia bacterium]|nr:DIP1984 family protein [Clostridia bacterium]